VAILYTEPRHWLEYDLLSVTTALIGAKSAVQSLTTVPYQRDWVERLQQIQLKMEVAGTSRIEGADFTDQELESALRPEQSTEQLLTRSQRQAHAATVAYRWISELPPDYPISLGLICDIHARIVTGCDDDLCPPGKIRAADHNVTFGQPRHRGSTGGAQCQSAIEHLVTSAQTEYPKHDPLIQAIGLHYHIAAMHPFLDGNGRTARALESFMFQKAGLRDTAFIAMSNYYYDEKTAYLATLAQVRSSNHDLTSFLVFALKGLEIQCNRLLREIKKQMQKALFKDTMFSLFNRLKNQRTRVIQKRQVDILQILLEVDSMGLEDLWRRMRPAYETLDVPIKAFNRDIGSLNVLGAITANVVSSTPPKWNVEANLAWPSEITELAFFARLKSLPQGKTYSFLT
jgi:Fic family protein